MSSEKRSPLVHWLWFAGILAATCYAPIALAHLREFGFSAKQVITVVMAALIWSIIPGAFGKWLYSKWYVNLVIDNDTGRSIAGSANGFTLPTLPPGAVVPR